MMRTRAKQKHVARDRARRENVPRHILFHYRRELIRLKITYIHHSSFSVELENAVILFDYFKGTLPEFPAEYIRQRIGVCNHKPYRFGKRQNSRY